jgi:hypothetical protein
MELSACRGEDNRERACGLFRGCGCPDGRVFMGKVISLKLLAFVTASSMLLGTYVLATLRRRLGGLLDGWQSDPVAALPTPTSSK